MSLRARTVSRDRRSTSACGEGEPKDFHRKVACRVRPYTVLPIGMLAEEVTSANHLLFSPPFSGLS